MYRYQDISPRHHNIEETLRDLKSGKYGDASKLLKAYNAKDYDTANRIWNKLIAATDAIEAAAQNIFSWNYFGTPMRRGKVALQEIRNGKSIVVTPAAREKLYASQFWEVVQMVNTLLADHSAETAADMAKKKAKADGELFDVSVLKEKLKAVDQSYDDEFKALERRRKDAREKELADLKQRRGEMAAERNQLDINISKADKIIADLSGKPVLHSAGAVSGGVREHWTDEQYEAACAKAMAFVNSHAKDGVARGELAKFLAVKPNRAGMIFQRLGSKVKAKGPSMKLQRYYPA